MFLNLILFLLSLSSVAFGYLFSQAQKSEARRIADMYPNSPIAFAVSFVDWFNKHTIYRRLSLKSFIPNKELHAPAGELIQLHDYLHIDALFAIRQSYTASIDISKRIDTQFLDVFGSQVVQLTIRYVIFFTIYAVVMISIYFIFNVSNSNMTIILSLAAMFVWGFATIDQAKSMYTDGVLGSLQKLRRQPFVVISIDNKMIYISGWNNSIAKNDMSIQFEMLSKTFTLGITLKGKQENIILSYPRILNDVLPNESELSEICQSLNKLVLDMRKGELHSPL